MKTIKNIPIEKFNIQVFRNEDYIDDNHIGYSHSFILENEHEKMIDFFIFCLDISKGLMDNSLKLNNLPEFHKTIENQSIDEEYLKLELNKKLTQMYHLLYEQKRVINTIIPTKE